MNIWKCYFCFIFLEMKIMHGDELRVRYMGELQKHWSGVGHVIKIPDSILLQCYTLRFHI